MDRRTVLLTLPATALLAACGGEGGSSSTTSRPGDATSSTGSAGGYRLELVAEDLWVPRHVVRVDDARLLLLDQGGVVHVLEDGAVRGEPFFDVRDLVRPPTAGAQELGLAGLALAPAAGTSGEATCYLVRTEPPGDDDSGGTARVDVLSRVTADLDALVADLGSERELLRLPRAFDDHVGGGVVVDGDGMLRVALGAKNGDAAAQDPRSWDGTTLRLDPAEDGYEVPADNPFVGGGGREEVYSYGYRNPFRLHWDDEVGLVVAQPMWTGADQQVTVAAPGGNAGYPVVQEAGVTTCWTGDELDEGCAQQGGDELVPPVAEYPHDVGDIVSGAVIYRGETLPGLTGQVVVADWEGTLLAGDPTGEHWALEPLSVASDEAATLWDLSTDGTDLYVSCTGFRDGSGRLYRLVVG